MFCPHLFVVLALFLATFVAAADLYKILDSASRLLLWRRGRLLTFVIQFTSQLPTEILELRTRDSAKNFIQTRIKIQMLKENSLKLRVVSPRERMHHFSACK